MTLGLAVAQDLACGRTWEEAVDAFLRTRDSPSTRRAYAAALYGAHGLDLDGLDPMHLMAWREQVMRLPLSQGSKRQRIASMRSFLRWTHAMGWSDLIPDRAGLVLRLPEKIVENPRASLTDREVDRLLRLAQRSGDLALVAVMVAAGLRVSEVSQLDVRDLHVEQRASYLWIRSGKGGRSRAVPLLPDVAAILTQHCRIRRNQRTLADGTTPLFLTRRGPRRRLAAAGIRTRLALISGRARIDCRVTPHMLRHTCGMRCLLVSGNVQAVAKVLGHRDIRTTQGYLDHLSLSEIARTLAPLRPSAR